MKICLRLGTALAIAIAAAAAVHPQTIPADPPAVVAAVAPIYPAIAIAAKASGDVVIEVRIAADGTVSAANPVKGNALLQKVCTIAAKRWKFATSKDSQSERVVRLTFTFRLVDDQVAEIDRTLVFCPPYQIEISSFKLAIETNTSHQR